MNEFNEKYEKLIDLGLFTYGELQLLTNINGSNLETLSDALFARYGERIEDLDTSFLDDEYFD